MLLGLRLGCLLVAVLFFVGLPVGDATELFALVLALDLAVGALVLRVLAADITARSLAWLNIGSGADSLHLLRRTVPQLRGRRPPVVIAAQVRWRRAAETRRDNRDAAS